MESYNKMLLRPVQTSAGENVDCKKGKPHTYFLVMYEHKSFLEGRVTRCDSVQLLKALRGGPTCICYKYS